MLFFDGINHPTAAQVIADGLDGGLLYCGTPGDGLGKDFTASQYADYKAHRLFVGLAFENTANDISGGASGGAAHAAAFLADARAKGVDFHDPACPAVDEHVMAANLPLAVAYQGGFYHALKSNGWLGKVGVYGFSETLIACHDAGVADWYWGAGSRSALPPYTNIWQDNTGTILVGGSQDDKDWVLIPLPIGAPVMEQTDTALGYDGQPAKDKAGNTFSVAAELYGTNVASWDTNAKVVALSAQVAGLVSAVAALTAAVNSEAPLTAAQLTAIVDAAVAQHIQITGTVQVGPAPAQP